MFELTHQQLALLREKRKAEFLGRAGAFLREHHPRETAGLSSQQLEHHLREAITRGRGYDLVSEREVVLFAEVMLLLSVDFDFHPDSRWARDLLHDPLSTPIERLMRLRQQLDDRRAKKERAGE